MEELTLVALLVASVYMLTKFWTYLTNAEWRDALALVGWYGAGLAGAAVANAAPIMAGQKVGSIVFGQLTFADLLFAALALAAAANVLNDTRRTVDGSDTSVRIPMFAKFFGSEPKDPPPPVA